MGMAVAKHGAIAKDPGSLGELLDKAGNTLLELESYARSLEKQQAALEKEKWDKVAALEREKGEKVAALEREKGEKVAATGKRERRRIEKTRKGKGRRAHAVSPVEAAATRS
jgi:hypothetical protein